MALASGGSVWRSNLDQRTKILLYSSNIWYLGEGMFGPLLAVFSGTIGGDVLDISWVWAVYLVVGGVCTVATGYLSDRYIRKEVLLVCGYALNTLFTFGYLFVDSAGDLLLVQVGLGVASALATPTWDALYAEGDTETSGGFRWGLAGGQADILTGLAVLMGGFIVTHLSFFALFTAMGVLQAVATLYQAQILWLGQRGDATAEVAPRRVSTSV